MALDLGADVEQQIDLLDRRIADDHPLHDAPEPPGALATGRALAAALVHVEFRQAGDRTDDVGRPVHDDDGGGAETAALRSQAVEIHEDGVADLLRQQRRRRSEEHTSELQSLMRISYAVFCLKKKNTVSPPKHHITHYV